MRAWPKERGFAAVRTGHSVGSNPVRLRRRTFIPTRDHSLCTAWIALDEATIENGCLRFVPGSHEPGVIYPRQRHNDPTLDREEEAYGFAIHAGTYDEHRDDTMACGVDPYAWKGTRDIGRAYLRKPGPTPQDRLLATLHEAQIAPAT